MYLRESSLNNSLEFSFLRYRNFAYQLPLRQLQFKINKPRNKKSPKYAYCSTVLFAEPDEPLCSTNSIQGRVRTPSSCITTMPSISMIGSSIETGHESDRITTSLLLLLLSCWPYAVYFLLHLFDSAFLLSSMIPTNMKVSYALWTWFLSLQPAFQR